MKSLLQYRDKPFSLRITLNTSSPSGKCGYSGFKHAVIKEFMSPLLLVNVE